MQTSIAIGELGVDHTHPDAPALDVLSSLFNGFGGSLFEEIRSRQVRADHGMPSLGVLWLLGSQLGCTSLHFCRRHIVVQKLWVSCR